MPHLHQCKVGWEHNIFCTPSGQQHQACSGPSEDCAAQYGLPFPENQALPLHFVTGEGGRYRHNDRQYSLPPSQARPRRALFYNINYWNIQNFFQLGLLGVVVGL